MDQPNEKRHPTDEGVQMVNHLSTVTSQKGFYDFSFSASASYSSSHRAEIFLNDQTKHFCAANSRSYQRTQGEQPLFLINH